MNYNIMIYADEQKLRDSGISMNDDDSQQSLSTSTSSISDCKSNTFSYVQSLSKWNEEILDSSQKNLVFLIYPISSIN